MPDLRSFPSVPIIGQPVEVTGYTIVVNVRCKCAQPHVLQLVLKQAAVGQAADLGVCPGCARAMHIAQMSMNDQGQLVFGLQMGNVGQPPDAAATALSN